MASQKSMGMGRGLHLNSRNLKRHFRWMSYIGNPQHGEGQGVNTLPPAKGARPAYTFNEIEVQHVSENLYYPGRISWKPIQLTFYDTSLGINNPLFDWLRECYDPTPNARHTQIPSADRNFKRQLSICLYDGGGAMLEKWIYDNAWPQEVDWGELDMASSNVVTADVTLRYDRAYLVPVPACTQIGGIGVRTFN